MHPQPEVSTVTRTHRALSEVFRGPSCHMVLGVGISAARLPSEVRELVNNLLIHGSVAVAKGKPASGYDVFHRVLPVEMVALLRECNQMAEDMDLVDAY